MQPASDIPSFDPRPAPYWRGDRLVDPRASDGDRSLSTILHLWWVAFAVGLGPLALLIPVAIWATRQATSGFTDDHGREVINLQLTLMILVIVPIFWIVLPVWLVIALIASIRGAAAAGRREHFRYPMIFRILK